ncbi:UNVERIFIED_CONTAM: hypothetical protein Scaly_2876000 [Sesamum calycinum]|uniref:Uncharacterized protein n=1 Tax=Sesamum calycinum TaxID=2727403 RepID=A0AAW2L8T0_9LAMI
MKLGFINGKNPKPEESDESYEQWERADNMVISWILNSISKDIVESFLYIDIIRDLWLELKARFGCGASKEIENLYQRDHLMYFLMGLDESFENIRNQILIMEPLPNVSKAYAIVLWVERQREVSSAYGNSSQNMAMQAKFYVGTNARNQWKKRGVSDKKGQL